MKGNAWGLWQASCGAFGLGTAPAIWANTPHGWAGFIIACAIFNVVYGSIAWLRPGWFYDRFNR